MGILFSINRNICHFLICLFNSSSNNIIVVCLISPIYHVLLREDVFYIFQAIIKQQQKLINDLIFMKASRIPDFIVFILADKNYNNSYPYGLY